MIHQQRSSVWRRAAALGLMAATVVFVAAGGCSGAERPEQRERASMPDRVVRDMPAILRGTIGAESFLRGTESLLITGYGVVVGLNGTGSADVPASVRSVLEREMSRRGVGRESVGMGWTSPSRMLDDPNTAVVLVQAVVPPGAPAGSRFDVLVTALPGTATTSLEGGRLWTTDMRGGLTLPGGPDTPSLARASGDIFINPFADPASSGEDAINRRSGRVLNGGEVTRSRELILVLDNPSHARARSMVAAINTKFPSDSTVDRGQTAWGLNSEQIEISVPARYSDDTEEFLELLMSTRVDTSFPEEWARRYTQEMRSQPDLATELSWRLQAIGRPAVPFLRDLYDYPEVAPRLAALRAGARLGDALVTPHLKDLATGGPSFLRAIAIELLGDMGPDPMVNLALRELLEVDQLEVRIAAYEALAKRGDPLLDRRRMGNKFTLDTIPAAKPMVYVSQQGEPRIVIFGSGLDVKRPTLASGWSDRLMLASDSPSDEIRVYYLDHRSGRSTRGTIGPEVKDLIRFLSHRQTPENPAPGLDLSYSEVVGALHEIWKDGAINADFVAEQDKLAAELLRSATDPALEERPEFSDPEDADDERMSGALDPNRPSLPSLRQGQIVPRPGAARPRSNDRPEDSDVPVPGGTSPK
ncbi:MAG: hypothetical protein EA376_04665 [Phycisphaeraceae bacterium]|nr:MAG: hypothetical protein EA376_04665 [Phycisphaeraceae bacterium]